MSKILFQRGQGKRHNSAGKDRGGSNLLWPVVSGLTLTFVTAGLVFLWPVFKMAGVGVAVFMVVAVLASSLTPLVLLRKSLNSASPHRKKSNEDERTAAAKVRSVIETGDPAQDPDAR